MFKRLLVPVDGTRRSASIVPVAVQIAMGFGCSVRIVSVIDNRDKEMKVFALGEGADEFLRNEVWRAEEYLRALAPRFEDHGISTSTGVRVGAPVTEILRAADEFGCDIITMATRSRRNLGRLVFGSIADAVVRESRVPVLVYRVAA